MANGDCVLVSEPNVVRCKKRRKSNRRSDYMEKPGSVIVPRLTLAETLCKWLRSECIIFPFLITGSIQTYLAHETARFARFFNVYIFSRLCLQSNDWFLHDFAVVWNSTIKQVCVYCSALCTIDLLYSCDCQNYATNQKCAKIVILAKHLSKLYAIVYLAPSCFPPSFI